MFVTKLVAYWQLFVASVHADLLPPAPPSFQLLQKCIYEIQQKYFKPNDIIIYLNLDEKFRHLRLDLSSVIIQNHHSKNLIAQGPIKANVYVLTISEETLKAAFENLSRTSQWNPRANFVVVSEAPPSFLFRVLSKYYVFNVLALELLSDHEVKIWTYFPYNFSLPKPERTTAVLLDVFVEEQPPRDVNLFPKKLPKKWANTTLRVVLFHYPPFMICSHCDDDKKAGIEMDAFKLIQRILKFDVVYVNNSCKSWGSKLENGSYDGLYGYLQNYQADVGIGLFYANSSEIWDFDLSFPYLNDASKWLVPAAKRQPHWVKIVNIFSLHIWALVVIILVLASLILCFLSTRLPEIMGYQTFPLCFLICCQCLLSQSVPTLPKMTAVRTAIAAWVLFSFVMTSAFQSKLTSALNFDLYEKQISTVEELIDSKIEFGFYKRAGFVFSYSKSKVDTYIYNHYVSCPLDYSCLHRVAFQGDFATMKAKKFLQYMITTYYLGPDGRPLVYMFKENVQNVLVTLAFSRGFPIVETMNKVLMNMTQTGFIQFYTSQVDYITEKIQRQAERVHVAADSINLEELHGIFAVLFMGWGTAFVAFVAEHAVNSETFRKTFA